MICLSNFSRRLTNGLHQGQGQDSVGEETRGAVGVLNGAGIFFEL